MKKILLSTLITSSILLSDTVTLNEGWNLIGIPSIDSASILSNNQDIEKAGGGGEGNKINQFAYLKSKNYFNGNFILGQAYWIKALTDTNLKYTKVSIPNKISLYEGWNLIYPFKTILASDLANYPEIEKASGYENNFIYLKSKNYADGESLPNQGYWVKANSDFDMIFSSFDYQAWGSGTESKVSFRLNGVDYTMLAYSTENFTVDESISSGFTFFNGTVSSFTVNPLLISGVYNTYEIKLKIFETIEDLSNSLPIFESDTFVANNDTVNYGNITFKNPNDYSVPQPENISADLQPPVSPVF